MGMNAQYAVYHPTTINQKTDVSHLPGRAFKLRYLRPW